jgi:hypothetical protein
MLRVGVSTHERMTFVSREAEKRRLSLVGLAKSYIFTSCFLNALCEQT